MSFQTRVRYSAVAGVREYDVPFPYLEAPHVKVLVRGTPAPFAWITTSRIRLASSPGAGDVVEVYRDTPIDQAIVAFQDGATLTSADLNLSVKQALYAQQELLDLYHGALTDARVRLGDNLGVVVAPDDLTDTLVQLVLQDALLAELQAAITDIGVNAADILEQAERIDDVRADVDAILTGGAGLDEDALALILDVQQSVIDGDTALAAKLALLGAVNGAGTAFELNTSTVKVSPTETLATRLATISAELGDNAAAILSEGTTRATELGALADQLDVVEATAGTLAATVATNQTAQVDGDDALAARIALIGAEGVGGTSFILDMDKVKVSPSESIAQRLSGLQSATDAVQANVVSNAEASATQFDAFASQLNGVTAVANARNRTFLQPDAPSSPVVGDVWYDSDDGNKVYRWGGSAWIGVADVRIASNAAAVASEALTRASEDEALASLIDSVSATAASKARTFYQSTAPEGATAGDYWIDTGNNSRHKRYNGSTWVDVTDGRLPTALSDIALNAANLTSFQEATADDLEALATSISTVTATANAKNRTFYQGTAPGTPVVGDMWIDTANSNRLRRFNGTEWQFVEDTRIAANGAAIVAEQNARTTAVDALADSLDTVIATVDGNVASINTQATAISNINGQLSATYSVTVDVNGRWSGYKLQTIGGGGTTVSTFDITADKFRIFNGTGNTPVFEVSSGQVRVAGDLVVTSSVGVGALSKITADQDLNAAVVIPSQGGNGRVRIKTMNFTVDRADSKITLMISFNYESSNGNINTVYVKVGQSAPVWSGHVMTNATFSYLVSSYSGPSTNFINLTGLPVGVNTVEIWANGAGSGGYTNTANDCYFHVTEHKRAS